MKTKKNTSSSLIKYTVAALMICSLAADCFGAVTSIPARDTAGVLIVTSKGPLGINDQYYNCVQTQRSVELKSFVRFARFIGSLIGTSAITALVLIVRYHLKGLFW